MDISKWAVEFIGYGQFSEHDYEYYTGDSYIHQGCRYAVASRDKKQAKPYSSKKRAENALTGNFENWWKGRVVEIEEENNE